MFIGAGPPGSMEHPTKEKGPEIPSPWKLFKIKVQNCEIWGFYFKITLLLKMWGKGEWLVGGI